MKGSKEKIKVDKKENKVIRYVHDEAETVNLVRKVESTYEIHS
jgi:hypothetical protein